MTVGAGAAGHSRVMLPPPTPYQGPNRCPRCAGGKITGARYRVHTATGTGAPVLLADVICPQCRGCGRGAHDGCLPPEHADWEGPEDYDEDDDAGPARQCPSCHGRRWWPCQGSDGVGFFDDNAVHTLRVACGCATDLLVAADEQP